jgi:hypothetical protein
MSAQGWQETFATLQVDGPALNTSTTPTSLLNGATTHAAGAARYTLPAGFFATPGKALRVTAKGRISTFTSGTLTLDVRLGAVVAWNGGAQVLVVSLTNKSFIMDVLLTCRTIGSGTIGTLFGIGQFTSPAAVGSTGGVANTMLLPDNTPAVGTGFDTSVSQLVDLFGTWSVSNAANSIQLHEYTLEAIN